MADFDKLHQLTCKAEAYRDANWETEFLELITKVKLEISNPDTKMGPDGFPYIYAKVSKEGTESFENIVGWLCERGIGLVINGHKQMPDYIFTYGMIWNYLISKEFFEKVEVESTEISYSEDDQIFMGDPTERYMPQPVRAIVKDYLKSLNFPDPKITMLSRDQKNFDLCFSIESLGSLKTEDHQGLLEALSWFFPPHYSLALINEASVPNFKSL